MAINYHHDGCRYHFTHRRLIGRWLREVAASEGYDLESVDVIFCSSERLLAMNREFLGHDYFTDIITFDYSDLKELRYISGELYIDVETVADNACQFETTRLREMHRILVHGVLHLCGQGDKTPKDAKQMRSKENRYLALLDQMVVDTQKS